LKIVGQNKTWQDATFLVKIHKNFPKKSNFKKNFVLKKHENFVLKHAKNSTKIVSKNFVLKNNPNPNRKSSVKV